MSLFLDRRLVDFSGANADHLFNVENKNLSVADFAGAGGLHNRLHGLINELLTHHRFDFHLR